MSLILPNTEGISLPTAAQAFAERGWHVVPMKSDRSCAYVKYASVPTPSPSEAKKYFEHWPEALLCIRLPQNIVVLDIDPRKEKLGHLRRELHVRFSLPETYTVLTPKGGIHLWFELPEGVIAKNWTSLHGKFPVAGVDIRTNGGARYASSVCPLRRILHLGKLGAKSAKSAKNTC